MSNKQEEVDDTSKKEQLIHASVETEEEFKQWVQEYIQLLK